MAEVARRVMPADATNRAHSSKVGLGGCPDQTKAPRNRAIGRWPARNDEPLAAHAAAAGGVLADDAAPEIVVAPAVFSAKFSFRNRVPAFRKLEVI